MASNDSGVDTSNDSNEIQFPMRFEVKLMMDQKLHISTDPQKLTLKLASSSSSSGAAASPSSSSSTMLFASSTAGDGPATAANHSIHMMPLTYAPSSFITSSTMTLPRIIYSTASAAGAWNASTTPSVITSTPSTVVVASASASLASATSSACCSGIRFNRRYPTTSPLPEISNTIKFKARHKMLCRRKPAPYRNIPNERKLRLAASVSNVELLIKLLEGGTNPNTADDYQRSALHLAASRGYIDVVTQLLRYGADPNQQDSLGNTPLHLAVCSASSFTFNMVVRILLRNGANVHSLDRMGKNPLDLARSKLALMRMRCSNSADDIRRVMILLVTLQRVYLQEQIKMDSNDMEELEAKLKNLSTKEVEDEADLLLAKVENLALNSNN